jgi:glycosyltransferase involved in cell wall biosynthesis
MMDSWSVPSDNDITVAVSNAVVKSFGIEAEVSNNLTNPIPTNKALILVSATRTSTFEKGQKRMIKLSKMLKEEGIPFIWICFSDQPIRGADNIIFLEPTLDIAPYIKSADYLVQLSDKESFCYSIVEALELGTPVLTTPIDILPEIDFKDGENGYSIPFDIDGFDVGKIYSK